MQAKSTIKPDSYSVENCGGTAEVVLYENIEKQTQKDPETEEASTYYTYDEHRINVPFRKNLSEDVKNNREVWLAAAIAAEKATAEKRTLEEKVASLEADNEIIGAALEEVIAVIAGGE